MKLTERTAGDGEEHILNYSIAVPGFITPEVSRVCFLVIQPMDFFFTLDFGVEFLSLAVKRASTDSLILTTKEMLYKESMAKLCMTHGCVNSFRVLNASDMVV